MASPSTSRPSNANEPEQEDINPHDLCPVCHLLLYRPVTTSCTHNLCEACMKRWAVASSSNTQSSMETFNFEDIPQLETIILDHSNYVWGAIPHSDQRNGRDGRDDSLEASCPMCRTKTTAVYNAGFAANIRARYPLTYAQREREEHENLNLPSEDNGDIIDIELLIGNKHKLVPPPDNSGNKHDWTFFVRPNRSDFIQEVEIHLHPTFRPPRLSILREPYLVHRLGWGYFTIVAHVILKQGYTWMSGDAEPAPDGRDKGMLHLDWTLDFHGSGSFGRIKARVRRGSAPHHDDDPNEINDSDDNENEYDSINDYDSVMTLE